MIETAPRKRTGRDYWKLISSKECLATVLIVWVLAAPFRTPRFGGFALDGCRHPVLLLELLAPGLYAQRSDSLETPEPLPFGAIAPPAINLPLRALVGPALGPGQDAGRFAYLGVLGPLMLLVLAWSRPRWGPILAFGMLATGIAVTSALRDRMDLRRVEGQVLWWLFLMAACGLVLLSDRAKRPLPAGFLLVLGSLSVAIAAVCIGLSVKAGAITDRALLAPFLERLAAQATAAGEPAAEAWSPGLLAQNAAHLRAVLDHAALAAFASMTALLLHLKSRNAFTYWLVALVWAADVVTASWLG